MTPTAEALQPPRASLGALFCEFLKVSLFGAGGGVAFAHRLAVERRQWLTGSEFADILTLCQFMPGPNIVGIAVCVGAKMRGLVGAIVAVAGFVLVPGIAGFALAILYLGKTRIPVVQNILGGVSAGAAGLMIAVGLRLLKPHWRHWPTILFAGLAFGGLALVKAPLLVVLLVLAPLSIAVAAYNGARPR